MRKKWLWIGLLLALTSWCALFLPVDLYPLKDMSHEMAFDTDGNVYMVANGQRYSSIVAADYDGSVVYSYQEDSRTQERASAIGPLAVSDGMVYFIRSYGSNRLASQDGWELVQLDTATNQTTVLHTETSGAMEAAGLSVTDRMVYITCVGQGSRAGVQIDTVELYRFNLQEEKGELLSVTAVDLQPGQNVVSAVYGGGSTVCALLSDGALVSSTGQAFETVAVEEESMPLSGLSESNGYLWVRGAQPGEFLTGTAYRLRTREVSETVLSGAATANQLALRVYTENGKTALARSEGEEVQLIERLRVPFETRLAVRGTAAAVTAAVVLVLALLVCALLHWMRGHRLRSRMTASVLCAVVLFFAAFAAISILTILQMQRQQSGQTATWYAQNYASALTYADPSQIQEQDGQAARNEADLSTACAVYSVQESGCVPVYQSRDGLATNADLIACMQQTSERGYLSLGQTVMEGRRTSLCAVPVRQAGEMTSIVVSAVLEADRPLYRLGGLTWFLLCALLLCGLCAGVSGLVIHRHLRPIVPLTKQMDRLAIGDTNTEEVPCADDELGQLAQSLKELSVGMAIRDYERNATLEACRRFVPHSMEHLLGHGTVTEINCGDLIASDGSLGLISFSGSEKMRAALNDRAFMDYVNRCFLRVSKSIRPQGGVLLTGGFDLAAVRVLFSQSPDKGVRAMLALLGEHAESGGEADCFTLLHNAHFLYGVAGTDDEAFPYLASSEVSFFRSHLAQLAETGCRLVVTDAFLSTLTEPFSTRYIGFLSSADGTGMYKLYEVLDCYGEMERTTREQYDARMQKAIQCFYQNDFYLARNLFLAILRMAPQDGVARWYLFACEHYFNAGAGKETRYDLFGISHG